MLLRLDHYFSSFIHHGWLTPTSPVLADFLLMPWGVVYNNNNNNFRIAINRTSWTDIFTKAFIGFKKREDTKAVKNMEERKNVIIMEEMMNKKFVNNRCGDNNFIIAIKRTNSAVIATLQRSHESLPELIFLSHSSVESRDWRVTMLNND